MSPIRDDMIRFEFWLPASLMVKVRKAAAKDCRELSIPVSVASYIRRVLEREVQS